MSQRRGRKALRLNSGVRRMKDIGKALFGTALLALSACATGPKISGHLSAQEVEEFMQRGVLAEIFAGHDMIVVTMDNGERYTARLPSLEKIQAYMEYRENLGKPVDYEME